MTQYILDACALIAFLKDEEGADKVTAILHDANKRVAVVSMNTINLLEVYYDIYRGVGKEKASEELALIKKLPIAIKTEIAEGVFLEAGRLKASYRISLADSLALAETSFSGGELITADHHEFDTIERQEKLRFCWIR